MKKIIFLALTTMSLLAVSSASYAWGPYYGHRGFYGPTVGIGIGVGDPFYGPGPYYYAPPPVYYAPPPVYIEQPQTYVERNDTDAVAQDFRYYCAKPSGYYPQVPRCPKGWLKVVPDDSQPR